MSKRVFYVTLRGVSAVLVTPAARSHEIVRQPDVSGDARH